MDSNVASKLEKLKSQTSCRSKYECCSKRIKEMAFAKEYGKEVYLICENPKPFFCEHSRSFGFGYFCACPINIFLSKNKYSEETYPQ